MWTACGQAASPLSRLPAGVSVPLIRLLASSQKGRSNFALRRRLADEAGISGATDLSEYYRQRVSFWQRPEEALIRAQEPEYALTQPTPGLVAEDPLKNLMWRDLNWYLPDDILTKVDRAAMACSLETRIPLLDRRIVEFAMGLPTSLNMENGVGKQVLRELLYRHVPRQLLERPKQGFAVPLGSWLRGRFGIGQNPCWSRNDLESRAIGMSRAFVRSGKSICAVVRITVLSFGDFDVSGVARSAPVAVGVTRFYCGNG